MEIRELLDCAVRHNAYLESLQNDVDNNLRLIEQMNLQLEQVNKSIDVYTQASVFLDNLIKQESQRFINELNAILNYGVQNIFDDCSYSINIDYDKEKCKAGFSLNYIDIDNNFINADISQCGGGIKTVVGVLMQIFFIMQYNIEPILFVDEGFSQVSSQYLPNLFVVISEICQKNNLKILLITHDSRILQFGNSRYEIQNGTAIKIKNNPVI